jgi:glutaminyl-peptide cyclotransferase
VFIPFPEGIPMIWLTVLFFAAASLFAQQPAPPPLFVTVVHETYAHDPESFTQGLVWHDGTFYESAGLYRQSDIRQVDPASGEVLRQQPVANEFFAEGLALVGERLIQITWQERTAFVYDRDSFEQVGQFSYDTEGWGLCYDGEQLVMSDGTANLYFRDPETFEIVRSVEVTISGQPQVYLNELECVGGMVYANVWQTNYIVLIDPEDGLIEGVIYVGGLLTAAERAEADVLNGIAYNPETERFYITGKKWPRLFEVTFEEYRP